MAEKEATVGGKPRKELHQKGREERRKDRERQTTGRGKITANTNKYVKGSEAEMEELDHRSFQYFLPTLQWKI